MEEQKKKRINSLNERWWYRLLQIIFAIVYVAFLAIGITGVYFISDQKIISDETYMAVGDIVKKENPVYNGYSNLTVGQRVYDKNFQIWSNVINRNGIAIQYSDKFPLAKKASWYVLVISGISILFLLIREAFLYIALGRKR